MGSDTTDEPKLVRSNFSIIEETTYVGVYMVIIQNN